jgi:hypothetical protein
MTREAESMDDLESMGKVIGLVERYMGRFGGDGADGRVLVRAVMLGYLAGSGVPDDEAVTIVEKVQGGPMMRPVPANPMFHGIPWLVPGPVSGAPYYND